MVPNIDRGYSFQGVTAYLTHDKRQGEGPATTERVGFSKLYNFIGDEARTPAEAAKLMALVVRDADLLKAAAGVRPGGRKAEKGPVWHASFAWHPTEAPDQNEMLAAVDLALKAVGLPLDAGYQTYVVQHTDTAHAHLHVVVNLVHPITGKQANPYRDLPKAQAWAHGYDKARGFVFCEARAAKHEGRDAANENSRAFNQAAAPALSYRPAEAGPSAESSRSRKEWQARKARPAGEAKAAADALRATFGARFSALRTRINTAYEARRAEASRFYQDRREARSALFQTYAHALDAVYRRQPQAPLPETPDRQAAVAAFEALQKRERAFRTNERTVWGRLKNASSLTPDASPFALMRLALSAKARAAQFSRGQEKLRRDAARGQSAAPQTAAVKPASRADQAARVKEMRAEALAAFDLETTQLGAAMKDRHSVAIADEKAQKAALARESAAAWKEHSARYGLPERQARPEAGPDRFGRSRDRTRAAEGVSGASGTVQEASHEAGRTDAAATARAAARDAAIAQAKADAAARPERDRAQGRDRDFER